MKVQIFLSDSDQSPTRVAFLAVGVLPSLLPSQADWKYARSADTAEFLLPSAVDDEIQRCGYWIHVFGTGASGSEVRQQV